MKSARINFGLPRSEYVAEVNDQGEAISFRNQDTDIEYIGGGGGSDMLLTVGALEDSMLPLGATNGEIKSALEAGKNITVIFPDDCILYPGSTARITGIYKSNNSYFPMIIMNYNSTVYPLGMYGGALDAQAGIYYD